jgi:hypothetical protein
MAASNAFGGLGAKLAITKETALSEYFLVVVVATLARFAYDVFFN